MGQFFKSVYYNENDLKEQGFNYIGQNVLIDKNCFIVGENNISIGNNVRIDGFCNLIASGKGYLNIGSFVHIGSYSHLSAVSGIVIEDFAGISQRVSIYSKTDDFSGKYLTGPTIPEKYVGGKSGEIIIKKHVVIGSGCVVLPKLIIGEGTTIGALSVVNKNLDSWGIYAGSPARFIKTRKKNLLELEKQFLNEYD